MNNEKNNTGRQSTLTEALDEVRQRILDLRAMRGYMVQQGASTVVLEEIDHLINEALQKQRELTA